MAGCSGLGQAWRGAGVTARVCMLSVADEGYHLRIQGLAWVWFFRLGQGFRSPWFGAHRRSRGVVRVWWRGLRGLCRSPESQKGAGRGSLRAVGGGAQDVDEPSACAEEGGLGLVSGSGYNAQRHHK